LFGRRHPGPFATELPTRASDAAPRAAFVARFGPEILGATRDRLMTPFTVEFGLKLRELASVDSRPCSIQASHEPRATVSIFGPEARSE
jgi:hypothetical protein